MLENEEQKQSEFGQYEELLDDSRMEQFEVEPVRTTLPEEPKKKGVKEILSLLFIAAMVGGVSLWCLWSGLRGLFFAPVHPLEEAFSGMVKGDVYEGEVAYASKEYCSLRHTINLIPAGTEDFYLMCAPERDKIILIRAPKGWDKEFTNDAFNVVSRQERGIVRKLDYDVQREMASDVGELCVDRQVYIDLMGNRICYMQIFAGASLIFSIIYLSIFVKKQEKVTKEAVESSPMTVVAFVLFFVSLIMLLYLLNMAG
ncbi:MAG: hypothetical protein K2H34_05670 [Lachnospiraceae bacterium]|nr:hypothetical protein [Lachnospiraceae bacterium]